VLSPAAEAFRYFLIEKGEAFLGGRAGLLYPKAAATPAAEA